ncbi:MAG TPA: protoheme IX farnesyltransferase [Aliiroseovarius sp.]|nr:protoheme IX farnesyltransferase [Aliiroseovarius sp.]
MSDTIAALSLATRRARVTTRSYVLLLKPRVMSLVVFTAAVGMIVAPTRPNALVAFVIVLLIALGGGAAGALNMWWDADIDAKMRRTRGRPVPRGRVSPNAAMMFGLAMSALSVGALWAVSNALAAGLLAFTIFFYVVIYTIWLKRRTPQNIVIGGASGALPPIVGWAAATGDVGLPAIAMFLLIFMWTPPHFWSLSLFMNDDYQRAGVPMLTVTNGRKATRSHILIYTILLAATAALPVLTGIGGPVYMLVALGLNALMILRAYALWSRPEKDAAADNYSAERGFFRLTLWYLFLHFAALIGDATLALLWAGL